MDRHFKRIIQLLSQLHGRAIFSGVVIDVFLSLLVFPVGFVLFGISDEHIYFSGLAVIFGLISVAVGGYVTAYLSSSSKLINVLVFGTLMVLIGVFISILVPIPVLFNTISTILIVPAALLGAWCSSVLSNK